MASLQSDWRVHIPPRRHFAFGKSQPESQLGSGHETTGPAPTRDAGGWHEIETVMSFSFLVRIHTLVSQPAAFHTKPTATPSNF